MTEYIVIRPAADAPDDFLSAAHDGRWLDTRTTTPEDRIRSLGLLFTEAVATDRVEERPDGKIAQVWEVRPAKR